MVNDCSMSGAEFMKAFGPVITGLVALFIFYLTSERDKKKEKRRKRVERRYRVKYITNLIGEAVKTTNNQLTAIKVNSQAILANPSEFHPLTVFASSSTETLSKILTDESSFIAVTKLSKDKKESNPMITLYTELLASSDFVHSLLIDVKEQTLANLNSFKKGSLEYQQLTDNMLRQNMALLLALQNGEVSDIDVRLSASIVDIDKKWASVEVKNSEGFNKMCVEPTIELSKDYMVSGFKQLKLLDELRELAEHSNRTYKQLTGNNQRHATSLNEIVTNLERGRDGLAKIKASILQALLTENSQGDSVLNTS